MLIFSYGESFSAPCALLFGGFDGLHIGHRALLAEAKKTGLPVVLTAVTGRGDSLFTLPERAYIFGEAGAAACCELPFTEEFRHTPPEQFLHTLFGSLDARAVFCGEDFRFGRDAAGDVRLLSALAPCPVFALPVVKAEGEKISTSALKEYLKAGDLKKLNDRLVPAGTDFCQAAYFAEGIVEHGREVGRTYGFPTLNLSVPRGKLLPPDGVYGGVCSTPKGTFPTIINIGARPTFGVEERKIEAHLDGFSGDLYGAAVRVYPTEYYRGIERFSSAEALSSRLERDIAHLRENKR